MRVLNKIRVGYILISARYIAVARYNLLLYVHLTYKFLIYAFPGTSPV